MQLKHVPQMQTQHTCLLLEEVIQECNLKCPTCFASSGPGGAGVVPVETVLANVDQRLRRENDHLDVVMVSGGEPTLHPQILPLLREIAARPVNRILLNTNGIRLAKDDELLKFLHDHRDRVEVYRPLTVDPKEARRLRYRGQGRRRAAAG